VKRAREGETPERLAAAAGLDAPTWIVAVDDRVRAEKGEVNFEKLPLAIARLLRNLDVGEIDLCEYHPVESPDGWYVVWRVE
jgi:hypothetical protein